MNKKIYALLMATVMAVSMTACSSKSDSSNGKSKADRTSVSTTEGSTIETSINSESGYTPYRIIVNDSLKDNPLPNQINPNQINENPDSETPYTIPESLYETSALVYAYDGYMTEEDATAATTNSSESATDSEATPSVGKEVLIISSDPKNNLTEFNDLTTNDDFSETTINEGDRHVTVKTALNYKGELYIVMEDNVAAMQEYIPN